ncbi:Reticulon-4-interacting protein 1 [Musa troglodytarum]|uniref:Reticulon-4-interacting protein 1 n=1 Tax=Musa troglodytarum TaxID=320322 RepID=A0A9E7FG49_9LILI|nr:Reticulon-4-interacting protein 1 [Musa troglodytarum]
MWQLGHRRLLAPAVGLGAASTAAVSSCRAVMLPRFGEPEVLEVRPAVGVPSLKPRDVLVRSRAVSINPLDLRMRSGYGRSIFEPLLPLIIGRDISGEVAAVGTSVSSLTVGQEVFGALHPTAVRGTYADYAILSEDELTLKPPSVTQVVSKIGSDHLYSATLDGFHLPLFCLNRIKTCLWLVNIFH